MRSPSCIGRRTESGFSEMSKITDVARSSGQSIARHAGTRMAARGDGASPTDTPRRALRTGRYRIRPTLDADERRGHAPVPLATQDVGGIHGSPSPKTASSQGSLPGRWGKCRLLQPVCSPTRLRRTDRCRRTPPRDPQPAAVEPLGERRPGPGPQRSPRRCPTTAPDVLTPDEPWRLPGGRPHTRQPVRPRCAGDSGRRTVRAANLRCREDRCPGFRARCHPRHGTNREGLAGDRLGRSNSGRRRSSNGDSTRPRSWSVIASSSFTSR